MNFFRLCLSILLLAGLAVRTEAQHNTSARLLLEAEEARPGETVLAGVELRMALGWHTYWRNPGQSGKPTTINWQLPEGVSAGEILWPVPEPYESEGFMTYVHHDTAILLVPLTLSETVQPGPLRIEARVSWLECEKICLEGSATVRATLNVGRERRNSPHAKTLLEAQKRLPKPASTELGRFHWEKISDPETRTFVLELTVPVSPEAVQFFPYGGEGYEFSGKQTTKVANGRALLRQAVLSHSGDWPDRIEGVLVTRSPTGETDALEVSLSEVAPARTASGTSLLLMLGAAFVGGLILNIMPCVLPVIALKILGFVQQSKEEPGRVRKLGLVYALGVLASFLALATLAIVVQRAGGLADWGMQFQNSQFVVAITVLVLLVALNLFGVFEINLGGRAMGAAGMLSAKQGTSGAFFNGILATALATPCSAPFLGVALGFAFLQPPAIIVLMFLTIGLGLAFPYVLLSFKPAWLRFLPKPGRWMERFKVAMGFPMLATAIWLFWIASSHFGSDGTLWFGLFLVMLALAVWVWGEFVQRGSSGRGWAMAVATALVAGAYLYALETRLDWRTPVLAGSGEPSRTAGGIPWERWSPEAVAAARAEGKPVLVDFTARWCLTCQVNKKTSIEIPSVRSKLEEIGAVAFIADYSLRDPRITEELRRHGRGGVPLVVVYPPGPDSEPLVLSELLTPGIVLGALDKAAQQGRSQLAGR